MEAEPPRGYLIIHNVAKGNNVGTLIRSAAAFSISEVWVVGHRELQTFGNQGTAKKMPMRNFSSLSDLKSFTTERHIQICGVEIMQDSRNIWDSPFTGSTAFLLGNEGTGLSDAEKSVCDWFVFIPQYQSNTQSLNVSVAGSIIFHHFARWTQCPPSLIEGEKFVLRHKTKAEAAAEWPQDLIQSKRSEREARRTETEGEMDLFEF